MNLTEQLEDWEWKTNSKNSKIDNYYFIGDGVVDLPGSGCDVATTFCDILSGFSSIKDCALCEVKVLYFEEKGHFNSFVGPTNAM